MPIQIIADGIVRPMTADEERAYDAQVAANIAYWRGSRAPQTALNIRRPVGRCIDCANHFVWNGDRCGRDDSLIRDPYEEYDCFKSSEPEEDE